MSLAMQIAVLCVLQVTLLATAATVLYFLVRRFQAGAGAAVASASLSLVLALTALAASPWPRWSLPAPSAVSPTQPSGDATHVEQVRKATNTTPTLMASDTPLPIAAAWGAFAQALTQPIATTEAQAPDSRGWDWRRAVWTLLAVCLAVGAARFAWGVWAVHRLVRRSHPVDPVQLPAAPLLAELSCRLGLAATIELRESADVATPATVGWWRPTILLPVAWRDWSPVEIKAVLSHELAHVAGRDYLSWLVARLAVALHFYHPLVHWLASRLQLEQELAADAVAVRLVGDRQQYLQTLAALALATPHHHIAGPARTLIPSRSLLMRRVEMLRTTEHAAGSTRRHRFSRLAAVSVLALFAIGIAGVRQAATGQEEATSRNPATTGESTSVDKVERIGTEVMPPDTIYAVAARPAEIFAREDFKSLREQIDNVVPMLKEKGLKVTSVAEVVLVFYGQLGNEPRVVVRLTEPSACDKLAEVFLEQMSIATTPASQRSTWQSEQQRLTKLDATTLMIEQLPRSEGNQSQLPPPIFRRPAWADEWQGAADKQAVVVFDLSRFRAQTPPEEQARMLGEFPMAMVAPALTHTEWGMASFGMLDGLAIEAKAHCDSAENATAVAETTKAMLTLLGNIARQQRSVMVEKMKQAPPELAAQAPAVESLFDLAEEFTSDAQLTVEGERVSLRFSSKVANAEQVAITTGLLLPAVEAAREAARRTQSINNLRQLALAMLNYESTYGHLPPAVTYSQAADGTRVGRSWRVELLPFLEQQALYDQYQKDQPWDSEANKKVLAKMPDVFRSPSDSSVSRDAGYFVFTGSATLFDGEDGVKLREVTDGTSNTLMLVDAKRDIPWTKPEDLVYAADKPLPELGGWHPGLFLGARADGSVQGISSEVNDEQFLRNLIEKGDGNPLEN